MATAIATADRERSREVIAAHRRVGPAPGQNVGSAERAASAALGAAMLALGLTRRSLAGGAAAVAGGALLYRAATGHCHLYDAIGVSTADDAETEGPGARDAAAPILGTITINKPAEELGRLWRDPATLTRVLGHFAEVAPAGEGRLRWKVRLPIGGGLEWETRVVEDRPGEVLRWESVEGSAMLGGGEVRFRPAPAGLGTEMTLRVRFDPPGGALGKAASRLIGVVPRLFASKTLHFFKSLAETGEIPTTEHQPAARADTR